MKIKQSFRADRPIRWTSLALAAAVLLAIPVFAEIQFSDVPDDNPHRDDINTVAGQRWFVGYRDGTYKPDQKISPSEMTRVLTRAFDEGLTRAEFASFMVAGNEWQKSVKEPLARRWDPVDAGYNRTMLYVVGYHNDYWQWTDDDGNSYIEPGKYRIEGTFHRRDECRWMRLGYIPEGGQNFDTIAATDAPLVGYFRNEYSTEPEIIRILTTDTAFLIQCK